MEQTVTMETNLTEAVRIVLKYEIQSLLTRLAETGEEYLVLTASTEEKTCGHLGTAKGETFLKSPGLLNVKQEFLKFCSGLSVDLEVEQEPIDDCESSTPAVKFPSQSRRKSTPHFISQQSFQKSCEDSLESKAAANAGSNLCHDFSSTIIKTEPLDEISSIATIDNSRFKSAEKVFIGKQNVGKCAWSEDPVSRQTCDSDDQILSQEDEVLPVTTKRPEINVENSKQRMSKLSLNQRQGDSGILNSSSIISRRLSSKHNRSVRGRYGETDASVSNYKDLSTSMAAIQAVSSSWSSKNSKLQLTESSHTITDMKDAFVQIGNMAKCLICNKILSNKFNSRFHWRSHIGDKRYSCDICNKKFTHPSNMKTHRQIHTGEKPYSCSLCGRGFRRRDYMLQHMQKFHSTLSASDEHMLDASAGSSLNGMESDPNQTL